MRFLVDMAWNLKDTEKWGVELSANERMRLVVIDKKLLMKSKKSVGEMTEP